MTTKPEKSYLPVAAQKAQAKLSEGRKELSEALEYMNSIKTDIAQWQNDTKDFFDEVKDVYESKKEEVEKTSHLPMIAPIKAMWETLPSLFKREDPTKKRFGRMLNSLVRDADNIYQGLETELDHYEERFNEVDGLNDTLLEEAKVYRRGIEEYNSQKKEIEKQLGALEEKLKAKTEKDEAYLDMKKEILDVKRALEGVTKERSLSLNKYQQTMNILDALEGFRDENHILLTEGRNLHQTLETNLESLRPLFDNITASADLVDFQQKALNTYQMLKDTFNPAMIAITWVAKGVSKVAAEKAGEKFIESDTINAVKQLVYETKEDIKQRQKREDDVIEELLGKKVKDNALEMKEGEDYTVVSEEKQEPAENK